MVDKGMKDSWRLALIGSGVMAETILSGVLGEGVVPPDRVVASDPRPSRRAHISEKFSITVTESNEQAVSGADLVILAVKPQSIAEVMAELSGLIEDGAQVLSIIAGVSITRLQGGLRHMRIARAMPNLPCRIHKGMTVWVGSGDDTHSGRIDSVLEVMGKVVQARTEDDIDRATAVNGTGPAIVAEFVKAFMEAATYIGEPRQLAAESVLATVIGTAEMIRQSDTHVAQLIDEVTSPGGTTSRALQVLKSGGMAAVVTECVEAAYERTRELGAMGED
jgi:pyrroline-5-carboxylate reductase